MSDTTLKDRVFNIDRKLTSLPWVIQDEMKRVMNISWPLFHGLQENWITGLTDEGLEFFGEWERSVDAAVGIWAMSTSEEQATLLHTPHKLWAQVDKYMAAMDND